MSADVKSNYFRKLLGVGQKDTTTRMLIPGSVRELLGVGLLSSLPSLIDSVSTGGIRELGATGLSTAIDTILSVGLLDVGVTKIAIDGEMVMPKSKGIGSVGEIIHLMGSRNEVITLEFKTDLFPGAFAAVFRRIIKDVLENAEVVYIVDDLVVSAPCIIKRYHLEKVGRLKTAIVGTLTLEGLPIDQFISKLGGFVTTAIASIGTAAVSNLISELPSRFRFVGEFLSPRGL